MCLALGFYIGQKQTRCSDKGKTEIDRKNTPITGNETLGYADVIVKVYRPGVVKMQDARDMRWEPLGGHWGAIVELYQQSY